MKSGVRDPTGTGWEVPNGLINNPAGHPNWLGSCDRYALLGALKLSTQKGSPNDVSVRVFLLSAGNAAITETAAVMIIIFNIERGIFPP
jgi:hypothetical protein